MQTHRQRGAGNPIIYLILAANTTRAVIRSAFCAGQYIQAPLPTCTIRIIGIIFAFANSNIFLLLLLVPRNKQKKSQYRKRIYTGKSLDIFTYRKNHLNNKFLYIYIWVKLHLRVPQSVLHSKFLLVLVAQETCNRWRLLCFLMCFDKIYACLTKRI